MKLGLAVMSAVLILGGAACDGRGAASPSKGEPSSTDAEAAQGSSGENALATTPDGAPETEPSAAASPTSSPVAGSKAPAFAQIYPGATLSDPATVADGVSGPGGMVSFTTPANPDAVIGFYREHAEAAGLASVMSMNQGESRGYGALEQDSGARLQVVATALENSKTSVLLTWSAGQ